MDATSRDLLAEYCERRATALKRGTVEERGAAIALEEIALALRTPTSAAYAYTGAEDDYPAALKCPVCGLDTSALVQCRQDGCPDPELRKDAKR